MGNENFLGDIIGDVTSGNTGNIEQTLIQDGESMLQQKTGFDVSSLLGGGQQAQQDDSSNTDQSGDDDQSSDDSSN